MDSHDDVKFLDYFKSLDAHKHKLKQAQAQKGLPARSKKSRDEIVMYFMFQQWVEESSSADSPKIRSSFLPPSYPPCVRSFSELKKATITNLLLETHHRGQYLLLRTITPTYTMTAVMAVVEDEKGSVLLLQLYNHEEELSGAQSLEKGTVVIVKEPYLKTMADGDLGIRVDHPSDIIFVPEFDELIPLSWRKSSIKGDEDSSFWKAKGNGHFKHGDYRSAIQCYSRCLFTNPSPELTEVAQLNRALSFLKSGYFDAALNDVENVLRVSELSEKALFRKGQALYQLGRFKESLEAYAILSKEYPRNTMATYEYGRASARVVEQERGKYNFKEMILEAMALHPPTLDHGTYVGPVTIKQTQSHGKGLFTKQEVKAGDLLLCEKAFSYVFHDKIHPKDLHLFFDIELDSVSIGSQGELIEIIVQKLHKNPSLLSKFVDLYHGTYKSVDFTGEDSTHVVDMFLVEKAILLNGFGAVLLTRDSHIDSVQWSSEIEKTANDGLHSGGVWSMASYMNHSCMSNSFRSFIGDMMILRASMDLPPNTEITTWYKSPLISSPKDSLVDMDHWGFKCDCILCQDKRTLGERILLERTRIEKDLQDLLNTPENTLRNLRKVEEKIASLASTYCRPASEVPRLELETPCMSLAMKYASIGNDGKTMEFALMSLAALGFVITPAPLFVHKWGVMTNDVPACWMIMRYALYDLSPISALQAVEYARISYRICVGEDETFDETYSMASDRIDGLLTATK